MAIIQNKFPKELTTPLFGATFLEEHAGNLIQNPQLTIVEIIANSLDAGADQIKILWPENLGDICSFEDNGTGMTIAEFQYRWMYLNYNRPLEQGDFVIYPSENRESKRKAFGRNGKGRHGMFCFSESYQVETWKDGTSSIFQVSRIYEDKKTPYTIKLLKEYAKQGHGTTISAKINTHILPIQSVKEIIWSKFIADPAVDIFINNEKLNLLDFSSQLESEVVKVQWGEVPIYFIEGGISGRTSLQNGIAWWVNGRCVGELSWKRMSELGMFIDRRTSEGKRFTFIVQADILIEDVAFDWTKFDNKTERGRETLIAVENHIEGWLRRTHFPNTTRFENPGSNGKQRKIGETP